MIDRLVRKPGAFENYVYKADLFPTHRFRMAYDLIRQLTSSERAASKRYLKILHLAATENEAAVEGALHVLIDRGECPNVEAVQGLVEAGCQRTQPLDIEIAPVELALYDALLVPAAEVRI